MQSLSFVSAHHSLLTPVGLLFSAERVMRLLALTRAAAAAAAADDDNR